MDLMKAYDCIDMTYLRLILIQTGVSYEVTSWIMGCITSARYADIINGAPTLFSKCNMRIRQGCALSPYVPYHLIYLYWLLKD